MQNFDYYDNARLDVLSVIPKKKFDHILEIGGGEFQTLSILADINNAEAWGVDLYPTKNKKIKYIKGSIEEKTISDKIPDEYFDLIMANDVIEHLKDSNLFIELVHKKLKYNGLLILSVPNIRQIRGLYHIYIRGTFPKEEAGLFDKTHLRWLCKKDVIKLTEKKFKLMNHKCVGRLVPNIISKTILGEFLGLQNLFVFEKK